MNTDPGLFRVEAKERLEVELAEKAKLIIDTDLPEALTNLTDLVGGYANHLSLGMESAGFPENEAQVQGWQTAWDKLRAVLDSETPYTIEVATYVERNLGMIASTSTFDDYGTPQDPITKTFYRAFVDRIDHPAVHPTAAWLFERD